MKDVDCHPGCLFKSAIGHRSIVFIDRVLIKTGIQLPVSPIQTKHDKWRLSGREDFATGLRLSPNFASILKLTDSPHQSDNDPSVTDNFLRNGDACSECNEEELLVDKFTWCFWNPSTAALMPAVCFWIICYSATGCGGEERLQQEGLPSDPDRWPSKVGLKPNITTSMVEPILEIRAKKPSLTLNLGTNGLKVTSKPPPMAGQAGCLQGQDRSAVTHPSSSLARCYLIRLSCDNLFTNVTPQAQAVLLARFSHVSGSGQFHTSGPVTGMLIRGFTRTRIFNTSLYMLQTICHVTLEEWELVLLEPLPVKAIIRDNDHSCLVLETFSIMEAFLRPALFNPTSRPLPGNYTSLFAVPSAVLLAEVNPSKVFKINQSGLTEIQIVSCVHGKIDSDSQTVILDAEIQMNCLVLVAETLL
ncbi:hypothetical protein J6590_035766 [Homalodisca vitripennis]|nr:hypothetical protein J6590_035766 [Homalodisca vitripennis]